MSKYIGTNITYCINKDGLWESTIKNSKIRLVYTEKQMEDAVRDNYLKEQKYV